MQVLKFGGTSVGSPERMRRVGELIDDGQPKIVVLSAVSGTTNKLVELGELIRKQQIEVASIKLAALREDFRQKVKKLYAVFLTKPNNCFGSIALKPVMKNGF
jgi:aspartate kinase